MNLRYDTFKKPLVASFCLCGLLSSFAALATSSQSYTVERKPMFHRIPFK